MTLSLNDEGSLQNANITLSRKDSVLATIQYL